MPVDGDRVVTSDADRARSPGRWDHREEQILELAEGSERHDLDLDRVRQRSRSSSRLRQCGRDRGLAPVRVVLARVERRSGPVPRTINWRRRVRRATRSGRGVSPGPFAGSAPFGIRCRMRTLPATRSGPTASRGRSVGGGRGEEEHEDGAARWRRLGPRSSATSASHGEEQKPRERTGARTAGSSRARGSARARSTRTQRAAGPRSGAVRRRAAAASTKNGRRDPRRRVQPRVGARPPGVVELSPEKSVESTPRAAPGARRRPRERGLDFQLVYACDVSRFSICRCRPTSDRASCPTDAPVVILASPREQRIRVRRSRSPPAGRVASQTGTKSKANPPTTRQQRGATRVSRRRSRAPAPTRSRRRSGGSRRGAPSRGRGATPPVTRSREVE